MNFLDLRSRLESIEGTKLTQLVISNTRDFGVPTEYQRFLHEVGFGRVGGSLFQFYDGIVFADEILGSSNPTTEDILIFGDDYQGSCLGFDRNTWKVVRVLSDHNVLPVADSFEAFLEVLFEQERVK
jgi:hypothetical protein